MSRTTRPLDLMRVAVVVALLIERRVGQPCPTVTDIAGHTAIPYRRVWPYIRALAENGILEVEEEGTYPQRRRRMRVFCGEWTEWTMRRPRRRRAQARPDDAAPVSST